MNTGNPTVDSAELPLTLAAHVALRRALDTALRPYSQLPREHPPDPHACQYRRLLEQLAQHLRQILAAPDGAHDRLWEITKAHVQKAKTLQHQLDISQAEIQRLRQQLLKKASQ